MKKKAAKFPPSVTDAKKTGRYNSDLLQHLTPIDNVKPDPAAPWPQQRPQDATPSSWSWSRSGPTGS